MSRGIRSALIALIVIVVGAAIGASVIYSISQPVNPCCTTIQTQIEYKGIVTATEESAFVGIYYAQPCINDSTTTYEVISSSQTYSNVTVYPSNFTTQDRSDYSITIATTLNTVATFIPITTTVSGPPTTACLVYHPVP